jgi:hypothetical protein
MASDALGHGLQPNAPLDAAVPPGALLYYIAARRIDPLAVQWRAEENTKND